MKDKLSSFMVLIAIAFLLLSLVIYLLHQDEMIHKILNNSGRCF